MITPEQHAEIRRLYFGEHRKVGTIAANLGVHHNTVRAALADGGSLRRATARRTAFDPYLRFIRATLAQYPRLRATRLHEMLRTQGYAGSAVQVRRLVRILRPQVAVPVYRRLAVFPGAGPRPAWSQVAGTGGIK
jgi:hypothetical protein